MRTYVRDQLPDCIDPLDLAWLAGLLEGEGSFMTGPPTSPHLPAIQISMIDRDIIERVGRLIGGTAATIRPRKAHWQVSYAVRVRGARAVAWMHALRPLLGERRTAQVDRALASYVCRSNRVLDDSKAQGALDLLAEGLPVRDVAARYGTSIWCIYDLRLGRTHRHLDRAQLRRRR